MLLRQLSGLLPVLRKQLGLPRLEYVSVQNQGDYLVEVPAERKDVPRVRCAPASNISVRRTAPARAKEACSYSCSKFNQDPRCAGRTDLQVAGSMLQTCMHTCVCPGREQDMQGESHGMQLADV